MTTYYVVTGANRGLGLEFVRQISSDKQNTTIAAVRSLKGNLSKLESLVSQNPHIHILECDTSSISSISHFAQELSGILGSSSIQYLINNAGINAVPEQTSLTLEVKDLLQHVTVNVGGPAETVKALLPYLKPGSTIMNMTSGLGSCELKITEDTVYSISKAALNMLTVHMADHLKEKGIRVICMDPGWVKTDMGGTDAPLEPEESISGMLKVLQSLKDDQNGNYLRYDGAKMPW